MMDKSYAKSSFEVLKNRPYVDVLVTRDSVAAGDDINTPHEEHFEIYSFTDSVQLAQHIASKYLPSIAGAGHSWDCCLNGNKIATLSASGRTVACGKVEYADSNTVHFKYNSAKY